MGTDAVLLQEDGAGFLLLPQVQQAPVELSLPQMSHFLPIYSAVRGQIGLESTDGDIVSARWCLLHREKTSVGK